jgi:acylpyruvate hydrolase
MISLHDFQQSGYALAIDLTARDLQMNAKKSGMPWAVSKGMDYFTPITEMIPASKIKDPHSLTIWLKRNGELKQLESMQNCIFRFDLYPISRYSYTEENILGHKRQITIFVRFLISPDHLSTCRIPMLLSQISQVMKLEAGDVILTGTPPGTGPVVPGDSLEIGMNTPEQLVVVGGKWKVDGRKVHADL